MFCQLTQSKKGRIVYLVLIHIKVSEKQTKTTSLRSPPSKQQQQNEPVNKKKESFSQNLRKKKVYRTASLYRSEDFFMLQL